MRIVDFIRYYFAELWNNHKAEILATVPTITLNLAAYDPAISTWKLRFLVIGIVMLVVFMLYVLITNYKDARATFGRIEVPYSIITHKPPTEVKRFETNHLRAMSLFGYPINRLFRRFSIDRSDWQFFDQKRATKSDWLQVIHNINDHLHRYQTRIGPNHRIHLFLVTKPTIALGFGALVGRDCNPIVYHCINENSFIPVFDIEASTRYSSLHEFQSRIKKFSNIVVSDAGDLTSSTVIIALDFSSHALRGFEDILPGPSHIIKVTHKDNTGHLEESLDWMIIAQEIGSVVHAAIATHASVNIVNGMPTALAFALGHHLGDQNSVTIFDFDKHIEKYIPAFSLNLLSLNINHTPPSEIPA